GQTLRRLSARRSDHGERKTFDDGGIMSMRILIADDNEIAIEVLRAALTKAGYEVQCACNGREAMEILRHGVCRLVISDWDMPEMNGLELCRAIRGGEFA